MKDKTQPVCIISVTHTCILGIKGKSRDNMCVLCSFNFVFGKGRFDVCIKTLVPCIGWVHTCI